MTYRGHTAVGGIVAVGVWRLSSPEFLPAAPLTRALLVIFVMIGALAPDLDMPQSYPSRRWLGPLRFLVVFLKWGVSNPLTWLLFGRRRIVRIVRHRGFSHSILGVTLAAWSLGAAVALGAAALSPWLSGAPFFNDCCGASRTLPVLVFATEIACAFAVGCLSHLFADALTVSGVPLFLPWSDRRFAIGPRFLRLRSQ